MKPALPGIVRGDLRDAVGLEHLVVGAHQREGRDGDARRLGGGAVHQRDEAVELAAGGVAEVARVGEDAARWPRGCRSGGCRRGRGRSSGRRAGPRRASRRRRGRASPSAGAAGDGGAGEDEGVGVHALGGGDERDAAAHRVADDDERQAGVAAADLAGGGLGVGDERVDAGPALAAGVGAEAALVEGVDGDAAAGPGARRRLEGEIARRRRSRAARG